MYLIAKQKQNDQNQMFLKYATKGYCQPIIFLAKKKCTHREWVVKLFLKTPFDTIYKNEKQKNWCHIGWEQNQKEVKKNL